MQRWQVFSFQHHDHELAGFSHTPFPLSMVNEMEAHKDAHGIAKHERIMQDNGMQNKLCS